MLKARIITYILAMVPLFFGISALMAIDPYDAWLEHTGEWALYVAIALMLIGPLQRLFKLKRVQWLRQPLGLAMYSYVFAHLAGYFLLHQEVFSKALLSIAVQPFLVLGAISFVILTALAATSYQGAMRFLKAKWKKLHALSMGAIILGGAHGLVAQKVALNQFGLLFGILVLIALWRWLETFRRNR